MSPDPDAAPIEVAAAVAAMLRGLDPGPLAVLRRMDANGAPAFWRLSARYNAIGRRPEEWQAITRILAILTPKGRAEDRPAIRHRPSLGKALCDGGDAHWRPSDPTDPEGLISEDRLARFLAMRGAGRPVALERLARVLARTLPPDTQIRPADIAFAILQPVDPQNRIARDYYARLDSRHSSKDIQND